MTYTTHEIDQRSPEWAAHRATKYNASDAAAMLGLSPYKTRNELIREYATGVSAEIDSATQYRFDKGHEYEATCRPWAEEEIGEDLFPATVSAEIDGLQLGASLDGLTMTDSATWEHKTLNEELAKSLIRGVIPEMYEPQIEQGLMITGAPRCLFQASKGEKANAPKVWYTSKPSVRAAILAGWKQFRLDVQAYTPSAPAQVVLAEAQESLPAVAVRMDGSIAVVSNLDLFGERLKAFIAAIKTKPNTDQEFANCEAAVKTLKRAEEALEAAEASALAQIDPVEAMRRTVADYRETARATRLVLEKVVKFRKEEIRTEIGKTAAAAWSQHVATINDRLKRVRITIAAPDFTGAMKGKKTIDGLRSAVDDLMAKAKIEASQEADDMAKNIATIDELTNEHAFLVHDLQNLVTINPEHLAGLLKGRIAEHDHQVKAAAEKAAEEARERIRKEEQAKAQAEVAAAAKPAPEPVAAPTHTPEAIKPASATAGAASVAPQGAGVARMPAKPTRPTDAQIIGVLAQYYRVHESKVIEWLLAMDLNHASAEMAKEFS